MLRSSVDARMVKVKYSALPNLLSAYRLAAAPVAAGLALAGYRDAFFVLLMVSVATDLLDGPIARWSGRASQRGALADTIADACTTIAALVGLYLFERDGLRPDLPWLFLFLASYGAAAALCLVKFGVVPAYHLYLSKAAAWSGGAFLVWVYAFGYSRLFFLVAVGLGVLANIESMLATSRLRRFRSDIASLFSLSPRDRDRTG